MLSPPRPANPRAGKSGDEVVDQVVRPDRAADPII